MRQKRVSIFFCGAQKGGTTSLDSYLREHPGLAAPFTKELHFFDDENRDWTQPDYAALEAAYDDRSGKPRYDATPIYGFWPPSLERIKAYNPDAKLIFLFRDPFDRAWSHWCMEFARGDETLAFGEAIRSGRRRLQDLPALHRDRRVFTYLERGFYAEQVRRALALFSRAQMLFLRSDDLFSQHIETLDRIAAFLEIDPFACPELKREHRRPDIAYPCQPTREDLFHVADLVGDDLKEFAGLTGLDVSPWQTQRALAERVRCPDWSAKGAQDPRNDLAAERPMPADVDTPEDYGVFAYWAGEDHRPISPFLADWRSEFPSLKVFGDRDVEPLIDELAPGSVDLYRSIRLPAGKSDIARLFLLYRYGGLYVDVQFSIKNSKQITHYLDRISSDTEIIVFNRRRDIGIQLADEHYFINGVIFARAKSSLILMTALKALSNLHCHRLFERMHGHVPYHLAALTGPAVLTSMVLHPAYPTRSRATSVRSDYAGRIVVVAEEDAPMIRNVHKGYSCAGQHWSERQARELLFAE